MEVSICAPPFFNLYFGMIQFFYANLPETELVHLDALHESVTTST